MSDLPKLKRPPLAAVFNTGFAQFKKNNKPEPEDDLLKAIREEKKRMKLWEQTDVNPEGTKPTAKYHTVKFNTTKRYGTSDAGTRSSAGTKTTLRLDDNVAGKIIDQLAYDPNIHVPFTQDVSVSRF